MPASITTPTHLHLHTSYSLLDGAVKIPELMQHLANTGGQACALTDHGVLFGASEFALQAKQYGIKPILGCELYITESLESRDRHATHHLTALATTQQGWRNLVDIVSDAHLYGRHYVPRTTLTELAKRKEGLVILSGCLGSQVAQEVLTGSNFRGTARKFKEALGNAYHLELQMNGMEEQAIVNDALARLALDLNLRTVVTNDVHYLHASDAHPHDCLLCVQTKAKLTDSNRFRHPTDTLYLCDLSKFPNGDAVQGTIDIASAATVTLDKVAPRLPQSPTAAQIVTTKVMRHPLVVQNPQYAQRAEHELRVIGQAGFFGYFEVVADMCNWARSKGIMVGPGRGSAAGSLVAYCLGITEVDPVEHALSFERFLNPGRLALPDIDTDIQDDRRSEVIEYLREKYGKENVAHILTVASLKPRSALKDVARVYGWTPKAAQELADTIPPATHGVQPTFRESLDGSLSLQRYKRNHPEIISVAERIEGLHRSAGIHAAGVLISDRPIRDSVPVTKTELGLTSQWEQYHSERAGLVKLDLLGLATLTHLQRCKELSGVEPTGFDDPEVYKFLRTGDPIGVFQLESPGMTKVLRQVKPACLGDVAATVALYRPGPLDSGMTRDYIEAKNAKTSRTSDLTQLADITRDTYGVVVYQEQVAQIAQQIAGYSEAEADDFRRAMGKKSAEVMGAQRDKFVAGCRETSDYEGAELFGYIEKFAGYAFNKSHAVAYATISYRCAWYRVHRKEAYFAALLDLRGSDEGKLRASYLAAKRAGCKVKKPHVNTSGAKSTVENGEIVPALTLVKGLGDKVVAAILAARNKPYRDIADLAQRVDRRIVNQRVRDLLVAKGLCDPSSSPQLKLGLP